MWVAFYLEHNPCWGMCVIYDIPDEEFLQNLIHMIYKPSYIWRIMLNIETNPIDSLVGRLLNFVDPHHYIQMNNFMK